MFVLEYVFLNSKVDFRIWHNTNSRTRGPTEPTLTLAHVTTPCLEGQRTQQALRDKGRGQRQRDIETEEV